MQETKPQVKTWNSWQTPWVQTIFVLTSYPTHSNTLFCLDYGNNIVKMKKEKCAMAIQSNAVERLLTTLLMASQTGQWNKCYTSKFSCGLQGRSRQARTEIVTLGFGLQQLYCNLNGRLEVEWNFHCSYGELWALVVTRTDHHYADMLTLQIFYWSCNKMIFFKLPNREDELSIKINVWHCTFDNYSRYFWPVLDHI